MAVSIIVPLAPNETKWWLLLKDLQTYCHDAEIIFVSSKSGKPFSNISPHPKVTWHVEGHGRAEQMNAGARIATGDVLWFLHADSRLDPTTYPSLLPARRKMPHALTYFELRFLNGSGKLMRLNEWGANLRSRVFGIPFGDQGFCITKYIFHTLGGFPEGLDYGEDHVFVWRAKQQGVPLQAVAAPLYTSARKYKTHGWFTTTLKHQYLWLKQAWPEWRILRKGLH